MTPSDQHPPADITAWMRADWDRRAREDARRYINVTEPSGFDFALSGCRDAFEVIGPLHDRMRHDMRVLEIGCGIGRLLPFLGVLFAEVHGLDVAPAMVEQAQLLLQRYGNIKLHLGDGRTLQGLPDQYFDLVFTFHVFQHIPSKAVIADYVREMFRVLRPGGLARILVKTKRWQHQGAQHDTWHGVELDLDDVAAWRRADPWQLLSAADFVDPTLAWVLLQKP